MVFFSAVAQSVYIDFSLIDPNKAPFLELPFIEVSDSGGKFLVLDVGMLRDLDDTNLSFSVLESVLQTTVPLKNFITFPNAVQYPRFELSSGILHLPIVHIAQKTNTKNESLKYFAKFTVDLKLLPDTLNDPFRAPIFVLKSGKQISE